MAVPLNMIVLSFVLLATVTGSKETTKTEDNRTVSWLSEESVGNGTRAGEDENISTLARRATLCSYTASPHLFCPNGNNSISDVVCYFCGSEGEPVCSKIPDGILSCMDGQVSVLSCYCVTYNTAEDIIEMGECILNCRRHYSSPSNTSRFFPYSAYDWNDAMCGDAFNRSGTLCGSCREDFYPLAYSYDMTCVQNCDGKSNWWKYILAVYLPLTAFCLLVLLLKISATASHLHGFILYSQAVSIPVLVRITVLVTQESRSSILTMKYLTSFYNIWNLDIFRFVSYNICFNITNLENLSLDFAIGVYPLLLIAITYILHCVPTRSELQSPGPYLETLSTFF